MGFDAFKLWEQVDFQHGPQENFQTMDMDKSPQQQAPSHVKEGQSLDGAEVNPWISLHVLQEKLNPLYEAIQMAQGIDDILFEHVQQILNWKESIDSTWDLSLFQSDLSAMATHTLHSLHAASLEILGIGRIYFLVRLSTC